MPKLARVAPPHRTWQFFIVMLACLLTLGATALITMRRTTVLRERIVRLAEPAQIQLSRVQGTLAVELAAVRGYLLTGRSDLAEDARIAQRNRVRAMNELAPLTDSLGASVTSMRQALERVIAGTEAPVSALLAGTLDRRAYLEQLDSQHGRFTVAISASRELEEAIAADVRETLERIRRIDRVSTAVTIVLALGALLTAALVARLAIEQRQFANELRDSETRFREIADNVSDFVALTDAAFTQRLYANKSYERIWGRPVETFLDGSATLLEGVHPDDRERVERARLVATNQPADAEFRVARPDGSVRHVFTRYAPIRDARGHVYRVATITEDITERKTAEERRVRLVRGFSHDVRNPIGSADGLLTLLEEGMLGDLTQKQLDAIHRARSGLKTAVGLVTQMLDVAKAEAGRLEIRRASVRLVDVAREVVEDFQPAAQEKGQSLEVVRGPSDPRVDTDRARVRQVLANLVSNAIKYTDRGGRATVSFVARSDNGRLMTGISVRDNGAGIPAEKQASLFSEFVRLAPDAADGSGIGLSISQQIAKALGGFISVDSAAGRGSTFTLWLPVGRRDDAI